MKRILYDVHAGQVWRDRDKRSLSGSRHVRITRTEGPFPALVFYRHCFPNNEMVGQEFRSKYDRFQRAFDLVKDRI